MFRVFSSDVVLGIAFPPFRCIYYSMRQTANKTAAEGFDEGLGSALD
jgi:hypothetical protein